MSYDETSQSTNRPSSNWFALRKKIHTSVACSSTGNSPPSAFVERKRRKLEHTSDSNLTDQTRSPNDPEDAHAFPRGLVAEGRTLALEEGLMEEVKNGGSLSHLGRMVLGQVKHTVSQMQPGKYLALDCEMVGVGIDGSESALARVSVVNYYGYVLLDAFVRPRERVVDYRTEFSGIRPSYMVHARRFEEVQKQVADLLKDRILVGHAVHNDLKALLLSHPRPQTRDTQVLAYKYKVSRGRRPALRHLVKQELGLTIQGGEHSSVTDARATMALFRLHRKTWEQNTRPMATARTRPKSPIPASSIPRKRSLSDAMDEEPSETQGGDDADLATSPRASTSSSTAKKKGKVKAQQSFPRGGRCGVSSGLSTVVKRHGVLQTESLDQAKTTKTNTKEKWWEGLGDGGGSKDSARLRVR